MKNNYTIEDFKLWEDYIELLRWFKKDLCSPIFVCPENLHQVHDKLVLKKEHYSEKNIWRKCALKF